MAADGNLGVRNLEEIAYYETVEHNFTTVLKSTNYEDVFGTNASCILGRAETLGP